jgi:hypothetical protein
MPYYTIPSTPGRTREVLQRFLQENAGIAPGSIAGRRRPQPPVNLVAQVGTSQVVLTWNAPQNSRGILGWNIYRDNETNRVLNINDPNTLQATLAMPASPIGFYVSSYNALQESIKVQVIAKASSGGGSLPSSPPGWNQEPTGGGASGGKQNYTY